MSHWLDRFPIVPVIVADRSEIAADLAHALHDGGVDCAEITLRTPRALDVLAAMAAAAPPGFVVGAGTVLDVAQVDRVADAGAAFVVSPGFDADVVERAQTRGLEVLPGGATATEVQRARRAGLGVVKFFPADLLGGPAAIDALSAVFGGTGFVPSGGVGPHNAAEYLSRPTVPSVSGSWLAPRAEIAAGDLSRVAERGREAMQYRAAS